MCPNCRAFISNVDRVCPYCEFELAPAPPPIARRGNAIANAIPQAHSLTSILMLMNVGLYAASMLYSGGEDISRDFDAKTLTEMGAMRYEDIRFGGQWWRILTAGFLHGGPSHFFLNMLALYQLGNEVEQGFEAHRYVSIYVLSTMVGFFCSYFWGNVLSVGASAGLFGLLGALIAWGILQRSSMGDDIKRYYIRLVLFMTMMQLFLPTRLFGRTDYAAHFGGLLGGFVVAWLAGLPTVHDNFRERFARYLCWFSVALVVLCYAKWATVFFRT